MDWWRQKEKELNCPLLRNKSIKGYWQLIFKFKKKMFKKGGQKLFFFFKADRIWNFSNEIFQMHPPFWKKNPDLIVRFEKNSKTCLPYLKKYWTVHLQETPYSSRCLSALILRSYRLSLLRRLMELSRRILRYLNVESRHWIRSPPAVIRCYSVLSRTPLEEKPYSKTKWISTTIKNAIVLFVLNFFV